MICPQCHAERCLLFARDGVPDYAAAIAGLRPWQCRNCLRRFYAWSVALPFAIRAHCRRCGRLELQRISPKYVKGFTALFGNLFRVPAYRCEPCRTRFFSLRPYRPVRVLRMTNQSGQESRPRSRAASSA